MQLNYRNIVCDEVDGPYPTALNMVCMLVKQYIYRKRCQKVAPNEPEVSAEIFRCKSTEKYYAVKNGQLIRFAKRWKCQNELIPTDDVAEYIQDLEIIDS